VQICTFNINTVYFSGCVSKLNNSTIHLIEVFLTRKHTFWQTDVPDKRPPTECYMSNYSIWPHKHDASGSVKCLFRFNDEGLHLWHFYYSTNIVVTRSTKHTYRSKDLVTRTPLKTGGELRCSGRVSTFCSTSDTCRVNLATNPMIRHEWGKDREKEMMSIFPLWTFHSYVATFQQHLHMEYASLSWYDIPELVVPIKISLIEGFC
jgi:hypothetical protein